MGFICPQCNSDNTYIYDTPLIYDIDAIEVEEMGIEEFICFDCNNIFEIDTRIMTPETYREDAYRLMSGTFTHSFLMFIRKFRMNATI